MSSTRRAAFEILLRFEKSGSNRLKADSLIQDTVVNRLSDGNEQDKGFVHALVMGTLRHWLRLDEWILQLTGRPLKQISPPVRVLLRLGLFQLYGLSQVPAYAAVNTTVDLARTLKQSPRTVKFINAVLREAQRRLENSGFAVPDFDNEPARHLLLVYGWPEAWSTLLLQQHTPADILSMAQAAQQPAPLTLRVNTLRTTPPDYLQALQQAGYTAEVIDPERPEGLRIEGVSGSPRQLPGYDEGWFYVQDPASMAVAPLLAPDKDSQVLDLCAAPGSKTSHAAALMANTGNITAVEPKPDRLRLLTENLQRLGVTNVESQLMDGLTLDSSEAYDRVLVDAPCSGTGTLRRHPEILLQLRKPDFQTFIKQQAALLQKGFDCLKPGGMLVYSTCSIMHSENQAVVAAFLKKNKSARLDGEQQCLITPNADGFYTTRILKLSNS